MNVIVNSDTTRIEGDRVWRTIEFTCGKRNPSVSVVTDRWTGAVTSYWLGGMSAHPAARVGKRFDTLDAMCDHYRKSIGEVLRGLLS